MRNATVTNCQPRPDSASSFTFDVVPDGTTVVVTVEIPAGVAVDAAGNANRAAQPLVMAHDSDSPAILGLSTWAGSPCTIFPIPLVLQLS